MKERAAEPFRPDDDEHRALLRQLWTHAFPEVAYTTPKSPQWKEMGWQVGFEGRKEVQAQKCKSSSIVSVCIYFAGRRSGD